MATDLKDIDNITLTTSPLTLTPFDEGPKQELSAQEATAAAKVKPVTPEEASGLGEDKLTPEERRMVEEFSEKIEITDSNMILTYGSGAQKKIADFSETTLENVRTKDLGEIGDQLSGLVTELKSFDVDEEERGGFLGFFKKSANKMTALKAKYDKASVNVDKVVDVLEGHQIQLLKDIHMLDKMYELNLVYFKEISMYILAGKKKLEKVKSVDLPALQAEAARTGLPEDAQRANDFMAQIDRFEKKIYDLELTRMISLQMAPQIRLVQNNDTLISEKIQSVIVNTIPLWKSQMVLALGVTHSQQALEAQRKVTDLTNDLLTKNAAILKTATIETAKESERGIVDIEVLKNTNQSLITTLDEVLKIQTEGRQKRHEAEVELVRIEDELKQKLLQTSTK